MFLDCFYIQFPYFLTTGVFRPEQVRGIKNLASLEKEINAFNWSFAL